MRTGETALGSFHPGSGLQINFLPSPTPPPSGQPPLLWAVPSRSRRSFPSPKVVSRHHISPPLLPNELPAPTLRAGSAPRSLRTEPGKDARQLLIPLLMDREPRTPAALRLSCGPCSICLWLKIAMINFDCVAVSRHGSCRSGYPDARRRMGFRD
jgi:hypothetical protein